MTPPKITVQLKTAKLAILASLADAEISALLAAHRYPAWKLREGEDVYQAALEAVEQQRSAVEAQQLAFRLSVVMEHGARDAYQTLAAVARAIYTKDEQRLSEMHLADPSPEETAAFITTASILFEEARRIPDLVNFGYDERRLEDEREKIAAFYVASQRHEAAKGVTQRATAEMEAALRALDDWTTEYFDCARVALRGKKRLLQKIGLASPTTAAAKKGHALPTAESRGRRSIAGRPPKK